MGDTILRIEQLKKNFRSHWTFRPIEALKGISLEIERGESFGFLGHNGAGKTTTIKCILGLIHKTAGHIHFDGKEVHGSAHHEKLGYLPEQPYFYDHLTVEETLDFFAALHAIPKPGRKKVVLDTLERLGIADRRKNSVRSLSKGLQQRLGFAQAIINKPQLLLLDEPFSGLDPIGRLELRKLILEMNEQGTTIFLSSHILSDVEDICSRVSIMTWGEIKTVFSLEESSQLFGHSYELTIREDAARGELYEQLSSFAGAHDVEATVSGTIYTFHFTDYAIAEQAIAAAVSAGAKIESYCSKTPSLEEIFMDVTEHSSTEKQHT